MVEIKCISSGSKGNAYLVTCGENTILLDCGVSYQQILSATGYHPDSIHVCCITHEHGDHAKCYRDLLKNGIPIITSEGTAEALGIAKSRDVLCSQGSLHITQGEKMEIWMFDVVHDARQPVGFLLKFISQDDNLLYITDTMYVSSRFKNIRHVMIECNFVMENIIRNQRDRTRPLSLDRRVIRNHLSLDECVNTLTAIKRLSPQLEDVFLLHLSDSNANEEMMRDMVEKKLGLPVYIF